MKGVIRGHGKKTTYWIDNRQVTKEEFDEVFPDKPLNGQAPYGPPTKGWPIHSDALGYHPKQIPEAIAHLEKLGVPTEIDPLGRPVLRDRDHRRRVMKALHVHDNDGGYGDG